MDDCLLNAALHYAKRGWLVFPCKPGQKDPLINGGCRSASNNEETIRTWWTRWPMANIGLACGKASGVYVVDVDVDEGVNGFKSAEEIGALPETMAQHTPRGGAHFFFKTDNPPRNKNGLKHGIDIRADGYYVILAPSVHPNGKRYCWMEGHGIDEIELSEFPNSFRPEEKKIAAPWDKVAHKPLPKINRNDVIERASAYLAECEPAVLHNAGHDKLLRAASILVNGFDLDESTALNLLWSEYNPRCSPPWDRTSKSDVSDFERKVKECHKGCSKPRGYLLQSDSYQQDSALDELGAKLAEALLATPKEISAPEIVIKSMEHKEADKAGDWNTMLFNPTGYVGQLNQWINQTAVCPQPKLTLACSLVSSGALFGGKIRDRSNQRTNLYSMGIAPSSAGKDHPFKCVSELFEAAGAGALVGGGSVTSDSAVEMALMNHPVKMFAIDEAGDFLSGIKQAGASSGSAHLGTIKPCFKILWSSANRMYKGKQKAEQELRQINEPHVSLWALTTPNRFYQGISSADLEDGFVPRMLIALSDTRESYREIDYLPPPQSLIDDSARWFSRIITGDDQGGDILTATKKLQLIVDASSAAKKVFMNFAGHCEVMLRQGDVSGDITSPLWGKGLENAKRIALILACGDRYDFAEISEFHAVFACSLVRQTICDLIHSIKVRMADTPWELEKKKILKIISEYGSAGIPKNEITRRTQHIKDKKTRDGYIVDLCESNLAVSGMKKVGKRMASWLWVYPYGLGDNDEA